MQAELLIKASGQSAFQYTPIQEASGEDNIIVLNNTLQAITLVGIAAPGDRILTLINRGTKDVILAAASTEAPATHSFLNAATLGPKSSAILINDGIGWTVTVKTSGSTGTTVADATATVSPTAADSGKYYRLSHGSPTFNLPTTSLVVGETEFWVTFAGNDGTVDAGTGKTVDRIFFDIPGSANPAGSATQTAVRCVPFCLFHLKYVATNVWASDIITYL